VLGLIVLGGVIAVFTSSRQAGRLNEAVVDVQENGRFALAMLGQDLRMIGAPASAPVYPWTQEQNKAWWSVTNPATPGRRPPWIPGAPQLYSDQSVSAGVLSLATFTARTGGIAPVANSSAVISNRVDACGGYLIGNLVAARTVRVYAPQDCGWEPGDVLVVNDPEGSPLWRLDLATVAYAADVYTVTYAPPAGVNRMNKYPPATLAGILSGTATNPIWVARERTLGLAAVVSGNGIPELLRVIQPNVAGAWAREPLVEGVDDVTFRPLGGAGFAVSLLMRSENSLGTGQRVTGGEVQTWPFDANEDVNGVEEPITFGDGRLRHVYQQTIQMRSM